MTALKIRPFKCSAMTFTPEQVRKYGLEPYAVYGGIVYSFKCDKVPGKVFDIDRLPGILMEAQNNAAAAENNDHPA